MKALLKHISLAIVALVAMLPEAAAQTPAPQLFSPSAKDIDKVAAKVTKNKDDAEVRMVLIKNCINEYMANPAVASGYTSATAAETADSIKTLKNLLRMTGNTLAELDSRIAVAEDSRAAATDELTATRDSLQAVLVALTRRKAEVDSVIASYAAETEAIHSGIDGMRAEAVKLEKNNERATRIKDAATAKRSHAATVVDQLSTMETEVLRMPIDSDFTPALANARKLLDSERGLLASYGQPQQMADAERSVAHIAELADYSTLIAIARKTMAAKYDPKAIEAARNDLQAYYQEHNLDNKEHTATVKAVLYELKEGPVYYRNLNEALDKIKNHNMGWLFAGGDDVPDFNAIMEAIGTIPDAYPLMKKAKADMVLKLRDSGKPTINGDELNSIVETIRKQF